MLKFDIPEPFNSQKFIVFQKGISEHPSIDVHINERRDFLFLYPTPKTDYEKYIPRGKKYILNGYKENLHVIRRRLHKIEHLFENTPHRMLEIGAGEGRFLKLIRQNLPGIHVTAVDKDQNTLRPRIKSSDLERSGKTDTVIWVGKGAN